MPPQAPEKAAPQVPAKALAEIALPPVEIAAAQDKATKDTVAQDTVAQDKVAQDKVAQDKAVRQGPLPVWKELLFLLIKIASIVLVLVLLCAFVFGLLRYQDPSMSPAIKDGDLVIYYRYTKAGYIAQDIIILEFEGQKQARRVVATAGDKVDITPEGGLVINGALQQEPGIYQVTERYAEGVSFPLIVPEGYVFVLGDSRVGATDSRIYGCVKIEDTLGKVMTVIKRRGI